MDNWEDNIVNHKNYYKTNLKIIVDLDVPLNAPHKSPISLSISLTQAAWLTLELSEIHSFESHAKKYIVWVTYLYTTKLWLLDQSPAFLTFWWYH